MSTTFVINEPCCAGCGNPSTGRCTCQHSTATEAKTSYLGAGGGGGRVHNQTPQPLGLPVYNFGAEESPSESQPVEPVTNSNPTVANGGGLPSTEAAWEAIYNAEAAKRKEQPKQPTTNAKDGGHTPLGHPVWNW